MRALFIVMVSVLLASGCASSSGNNYHGYKTVVVKHQHPGNANYVVVYKRPKASRRCVKHQRHWHC